jgi:alpha-N-acetylglucosamine transferase
VEGNRAIATYLSLDYDLEFNAVRVFVFQILHQPHTKTARNYPLLVLVPREIHDAKRSLLESEGVIVVPVQPLQVRSDLSSDPVTALRIFE